MYIKTEFSCYEKKVQIDVTEKSVFVLNDML